MKSLVDTIERISTEFGIVLLQPQIDACKAVLSENDIVDVAVVGRFKAGKSSFLNAIIGKNIIPVGAIPVTAIVTRVSYGTKDRLVINYRSGVKQEMPIDHLQDFVTEQRNPHNAKEVDTVDVELAALRDYHGIRFVDTPGLESIYTHNTKASLYGCWLQI